MKCESEVAELPLKDVVHFVGEKPNVTQYFQASDVFVLPSREDPFPLVMMEAGLYRNPVICFDGAGGAPEFVEQDAGFVIPSFDVGKMADKIVELLRSPELRNRMGERRKRKSPQIL